MHGFKQVSAETLAEYEAVAERVRAELSAAGLPIAAPDYSPEADSNYGVLVGVDPGDDAAGGVTVEWNCRQAIRDRMIDALQQRKYDAPAIWRNGAIVTAMNTAITEILTSAGFTVVENPNDMAPMTLKVMATPTPGAALSFENATSSTEQA